MKHFLIFNVCKSKSPFCFLIVIKSQYFFVYVKEMEYLFESWYIYVGKMFRLVNENSGEIHERIVYLRDSSFVREPRPASFVASSTFNTFQ